MKVTKFVKDNANMTSLLQENKFIDEKNSKEKLDFKNRLTLLEISPT